MSLEKIVDTNTSPHADLFKAAIVCSIQVVHHGVCCAICYCSHCVCSAVQRKIGKKPRNLEARINSLKVLALTLLREVENLEEHDGSHGALDLQSEVHRFEAEMIRSALIRTGGRQRRAARLLGMKPTTLNSKIRRYQIDKERRRHESEK